MAGGVWQILELGYIGTPYIRFFSVSQLISDGLLLSFLLFWPLVIFHMMRFAILQEDEAKEDTKGILSKLRIWVSLIIVFIFIIFFSKAYWNTFKDLSLETITLLDIIGIEVYIVVMLSLIPMVIKAVVKLIWPSFKFDINKLINYLQLPITLIAFGLLGSLIYIIPLFHRSFFKSSDFGNMKYLDCAVKTENKDLKSYHLLYFNDKYIFIQITLKSGEKMTEVKKFETFLTNPCGR
ncbi:hypothetical protein [Pedobacter puniceum]|nr:hypothetical protein [Pedobacter puniceum]